MLDSLGLTIARQIPLNMIGGLLSGAYSLHGGVIRNGAGQIVSHLASVGGSGLLGLVPGLDLLSSGIANGQLLVLARNVNDLQSKVSSVLTVASTGAALSGIGLVVSIAGFAYMDHRFKEMKKLIVEVKDLIEAKHIAELKSAIGYMQHAETVGLSLDNRHEHLNDARRGFTTLSHMYGDLWSKAKSAQQIRALEECYAISFTGLSISQSELGMHGSAVKEYSSNVDHWTETARRQINEEIIRDEPERLIEVDPVSLPVSELIKILDFANDSDRKVEWMDEFRRKNKKRWPQPWKGKADEDMIEVAKVWHTRHEVLTSHSAHLAFLEQRKLSVGAFSAALTQAANDEGVDAICVLPTETLQPVQMAA